MSVPPQRPAATPPGARRVPTGAAAAVLVLLLVAAAGAIFALLRRPDDGPAPSSLGGGPLDEPELAGARPLSPSDVAVFGAEVVAVEGRPRPSAGAGGSGAKAVAVGDGCLIRAQLLEGPAVGHLSASCAGRPHYRSTDPAGQGVTLRDQKISELPGPAPGSRRYALSYQDTGARTGPRPQIEVDTRTWSARIYRQGDEPWSLTLHVSDVSFPRYGTSLGKARGDEEVAPAVRYQALVVDERGRPPAAAMGREGPCELYARGSASPSACRLLLRCGSRVLFGAGARARGRCDVDGGRLVGGRSEGGEPGDAATAPTLIWEGTDLRLQGLDGGGWERHWRLEPASACGLEGSWTGFAVDDQASPWTISMEAADGRLGLLWKLGSSESRHRVSTPIRCDPLLDLTEMEGANPHHYLLEVGPGWRTAGGRWQGAASGVLALTRQR